MEASLAMEDFFDVERRMRRCGERHAEAERGREQE